MILIYGSTRMLNSKVFSRLYHCYRPIGYCDWYKPPNEIYYQLKCPPCPSPKRCKPAIVCEKRCRLCSFWEQIKDNCCGFFWPLPPMPMMSEARVYVCKDLRKKKLQLTEAQLRLDRKTFPLHECYDIPECPEPNWEAVRETGV